ncbi:hypothetical protein [Tenacibaculum sp. 190524A02b]|uniref:hypothetical protein n=1 Tax=Tenacibaculum vairaonense TaxID=3137860 RepID=UPI0031FB09C2
MDNTVEYGNSLMAAGQYDLNGKGKFKTITEMQSNIEILAFRYYELMPATCLETGKEYFWRERKTEDGEGVLLKDFTYPEGANANGVNYSGRAFNFFEKVVAISKDEIEYVYNHKYNPSIEGQFGLDYQDTTIYLTFSGIDANKKDRTSLFQSIIYKKNQLVIELIRDSDSFSYFDVTNIVIKNGLIYIDANPYQGSQFALGDKQTYTLKFHPYSKSKESGTDLSYNIESRQVGSSSGNPTQLPLAGSTYAGLLPRMVRQPFNPSLKDAGGGANYTFNNSGSFYERVGNLVFFHIVLTNITQTTAPTGALYISGLPFSVTSTTSVPFTIGAFTRCKVQFYNIIARSRGGNAPGYDKKDIIFEYSDALSDTIGQGSGKTLKNAEFVSGMINISGFYPITLGSEDYVDTLPTSKKISS